MKKVYWLCALLPLFYSCSEMEEFTDDSSPQYSSNPTTRFAGDEKYDVLGYGYDATGEYLHPLSVRNPVLDIAKYEKDSIDRLQYGTSSYGFDQMYYGYSASDYTMDITKETNVTANMSYGSEKVDTVPYFSGNITYNNYLKTEYAYSDKYSFASVDAVRNRKHIWINDEVSCLSNYLSESFKADLERLSPDRIVERYGTHVLTDFIIGGRYKIMYRSVVTHTKDATHKRKTVASGLTAALFGIGFSLNITRTVQTDETLVKDNQNKELYVLFYGGNGTSLKYDLEKGMPTGVDVQSWENSINLSNSCLNEIMWKETYPIYEFISDPIKKEQIKEAVKRHITNSSLTSLELLPLYSYYHDISRDHCTTTNPNIVENYSGWRFLCIEGYVLKQRLTNSIVLHEYYSEQLWDHYLTTLSDIHNNYPVYQHQQSTPVGYIYKNIDIDLVPLYEYYHDGNTNHYTTVRADIVQNNLGWVRLNPTVSGYIYPAD